MLKIKQVRRYTIPKYPQGIFRNHSGPVALAKGATATAAMILILESCNGSGTTGPPPLPVELVTENEARQYIENIFIDNNVILEHGLPLFFKTSPTDSVNIHPDGYNDSLGVGYEYIYEEDYTLYTPDLITALDSAANDSGPYIKTINSIPKNIDFESYFESILQPFLDSLKANGVI